MIKARESGSNGLPLFYEKGQAGETPHSAEFLFYIENGILCVLIRITLMRRF